MSETIEEILKGLNDTELINFRPFSNSTSMQYNVLLNGVNLRRLIVLANYSLVGTTFREDSSSLDANF
jgi:hypothetical protein